MAVSFPCCGRCLLPGYCCRLRCFRLWLRRSGTTILAKSRWAGRWRFCCPGLGHFVEGVEGHNIGDSFAAGEAKESARLSESVSKSDALAVAGKFKDLVQRVIERGCAALPDRITRLPYIRRPKWRTASQSFRVKVSAELLTDQKGTRLGGVTSLQLLPKGRSIRFTASNTIGLPFDSSFKVLWRVTNTDQAAYEANTLRGDFYPSNLGFSREEDLAYRGVHFVEAFLIGKSDNRLYGKSEPFYVVVE